MKNLFLTFLISTLLTTFLSAEEYGSSIYGANVKDWKIYTTTKGEISKDVETDSIKLIGKGTSTGFYTSLTPLVNDADTIKFRIKYSHYFKVYVQVLTTNGIRYLTYYPLNKDLGKNGRFIQFGLGKSARDGKMQEFTRDLKADLEKFDAGNKLLEVRAFFIRGSGIIANIKVLSSASNKYIDMAKLKNLMWEQKDASSFVSVVSADKFPLGFEVYNELDMTPISFYTLSKDKKSLVQIKINSKVPIFDCCEDGISFKNDNRQMVINYPSLNKNGGLWQNTYDISDLNNIRELSHKRKDDIKCYW